MKIIIKKIKYNNNIFFIENNQYTHFYIYFAQKTRKDMLYNTRNLLNNFNIKLIQYNKQWQSVLPIRNQIPWSLYDMSSSLFIGFSNIKINNSNILKVQTLNTRPLIFINSYLPKQIFTKSRYDTSFIESKSSDFFSQLLINQYLNKIQIFNISVFLWLSLINK